MEFSNDVEQSFCNTKLLIDQSVTVSWSTCNVSRFSLSGGKVIGKVSLSLCVKLEAMLDKQNSSAVNVIGGPEQHFPVVSALYSHQGLRPLPHCGLTSQLLNVTFPFMTESPIQYLLTYLLFCVLVYVFYSAPKPFTELSVLIRKSDYSSVLQFKYVSCSDSCGPFLSF